MFQKFRYDKDISCSIRGNMNSSIFKLDPKGYIPDGLPATTWFNIFSYITDHDDISNVRLCNKRFKTIITDAVTRIELNVDAFSLAITLRSNTLSVFPFKNLQHLHVELSISDEDIDIFDSNKNTASQISEILFDLYTYLKHPELSFLHIHILGLFIRFDCGCLDLHLSGEGHKYRKYLKPVFGDTIHTIIIRGLRFETMIIENLDSIETILLPVSSELSSDIALGFDYLYSLCSGCTRSDRRFKFKLILGSVGVAAKIARALIVNNNGLKDPSSHITNLTPNITDIFKMIWEVNHIR